MERVDYHGGLSIRPIVLFFGPARSPEQGPPVLQVSPVASGTAQVGQVLSTTDGLWFGAPTITFTYQWFRAVTSGGVVVTSGGEFVGVEIAGATSSTYLLTADDLGEYIYCEVTATNYLGSTTAQTNLIGPIT